MKRPALVLFDVVGTLMTVRGGVGRAYGRYASDHGVQAAPKRLEQGFRAAIRALGTPPAAEAESRQFWARVVRQSFQAAGVEASRSDPLFDGLFAWFATAEPWLVYPDAAPALHSLRAQGIRTGVLSNFDQRLPALLQATGLRSSFEGVTLPADAGASKPDPAIFHHALAQHGVSAEEAWHVGDHAQEDQAAAQAAGLTGLLLLRGGSAGPGVIADLRDVARLWS